MAFEDPLTRRIADFLVGIGIPVEEADLGDETFLPGVTLDRGRIMVDESRLTHPGDLLHEAGHVAMAPEWARPRLTGAIDVPGLDTSELEWAAIPWSYAAAVAIGINPALVFHKDGYAGRSEGLLANFAIGVPIGLHHLVEAGMAAPREPAPGEPEHERFPHMLRWLR